MAKITFPQVFGKPKPPRRQKPPSNSGGTPYRRASSHMNAYAPAMRGAGGQLLARRNFRAHAAFAPASGQGSSAPAQTSFAVRHRSSAIPQSPGHHPALENMFRVCSSAATASPNAPVLIGNLRAPIARPHRRFTAHRDLCAANNKKQAHRPAHNAHKGKPALSSSTPSQTAQPFPAAPQSIRAAPSKQRAPRQRGGSAAPAAASAQPSVP